MLTAFIWLSLAACGEKTESDPKADPFPTSAVCRVTAINGPTGMGLTPLMQKAEDGKTDFAYHFTTVGTNDEIVAKLTGGEADIAAISTNLAAALYQKSNNSIQVLAVNTLGVLCVVTKGVDTDNLASLRGSTVYATGQGANPEYIIRYLLEKNGLTVGQDVKLSFVSEPAELVTVFTQNERAIAVAPQPSATAIILKDPGAEIKLDVNDAWSKISDTRLVMGCVVVRRAYAEEHPEAVAQFLKDYKDSVYAVNNDPDTAGKLCAKYGVVADADIAAKAIPYCHIVFETGSEMKTDLSAYLKFLYEVSPSIIGGKLPDDNFYYEAQS